MAVIAVSLGGVASAFGYSATTTDAAKQSDASVDARPVDAARGGRASTPPGQQRAPGQRALRDRQATDRTSSPAPSAMEQQVSDTVPADDAIPSAPQPASPPAPLPTTPTSGGVNLAAGDWLSGAAGHGVGTGDFGTWRGSAVEVVSTWADNNSDMIALGQLRPGGEYGTWQGPMDISIGAIGPGETWQQAANGAYDGRWRQSLTNLRELRASRPGTTFIRFAHEMNGDWYPWSVNAGNHEAFIQAWRRFHALQQEIYPAAKLTFGLNRESINTGMDWRQMFPGAEYVDVIGVDYYNQWPCVMTQAEWDSAVLLTDQYGAPRGLQRHLEFAQSVGLPLSVPEWGVNADQCDSAVYVRNMHRFFAEHAGSGPGQVLYESLFNVNWDGDRWRLYGSDRSPQASAMYRDLF